MPQGRKDVDSDVRALVPEDTPGLPGSLRRQLDQMRRNASQLTLIAGKWRVSRPQPLVLLRPENIPVNSDPCSPSRSGSRIRRGCPSHVAGTAWMDVASTPYGLVPAGYRYLSVETATQTLHRLTSYQPGRDWDVPVDDPLVLQDLQTNDMARLPWFFKRYAERLPRTPLPRELPATADPAARNGWMP